MVNIKEYEKRMREIKKDYGGDEEAAHGKADDLLCQLLVELGYVKFVKIYNSIEKWYA